MDPKNKDARKAMNNLSSMMDANAISRGLGFQLMDEGNPTPFGLFAIVAVLMMSLIAVKVISICSLKKKAIQLSRWMCPTSIQ